MDSTRPKIAEESPMGEIYQIFDGICLKVVAASTALAVVLYRLGTGGISPTLHDRVKDYYFMAKCATK